MEAISARHTPGGSRAHAEGQRRSRGAGPDCQVCAAARLRDEARAREDFAAVYGEAVSVPFRSSVAVDEMIRAVEGGIVGIR